MMRPSVRDRTPSGPAMATVTAAPAAKGLIRIHDRVAIVNKVSHYDGLEGVVTKIENGQYRVRFRNGTEHSFVKKDIRRISTEVSRKRKTSPDVVTKAKKSCGLQRRLSSMLVRK